MSVCLVCNGEGWIQGVQRVGPDPTDIDVWREPCRCNPAMLEPEELREWRELREEA